MTAAHEAGVRFGVILITEIIPIFFGLVIGYALLRKYLRNKHKKENTT